MYVCMYVCMYIYACMPTYLPTYIHTYIHTYIYGCAKKWWIPQFSHLDVKKPDQAGSTSGWGT